MEGGIEVDGGGRRARGACRPRHDRMMGQWLAAFNTTLYLGLSAIVSPKASFCRPPGRSTFARQMIEWF